MPFLVNISSQQVLSRKFKRIPFDPDHFQERLASGGPDELEEMHTALLMRSQAIDKHIELIRQLDDDQLGESLLLGQ